MPARPSLSPDPETVQPTTPPGTVLPPMFQQPAPPPMPGPNLTDGPSTTPPGTADAAGSSSPSGALTPPTPTELLKLRKARASAYQAIAKGAFHALGGLLNMQLADPADPEDYCFIPDDDDDAMVPPPLGRLAGRKLPIGKNEDELTDLEDIGQAAVGLFAWALKGFTAWAKARKARRRRDDPATRGAVVYDGTGEAGGEGAPQ